jgi:hypothetical protein
MMTMKEVKIGEILIFFSRERAREGEAIPRL